MSTVNVLADNVTLTGSAVASTVAAQTNGLNKHTLYVLYSPDTNSTNAMEFTIECSPDGTNWFVYGSPTTLTGAVSPVAAAAFSLSSESTADQFYAPINFEVQAHKIRIKASETNTPAAFGEYTAWLFSRAG